MIRFNDAQVRSLEAVVNAWGQQRVVLVGAGAVQCHMEMTWRVTADVDIVVGVDLAEFQDLLDGIPGWQRNPRLEHRIVSPWNIKVDVVPAGPSLRAAGKVVWPQSQQEMQLVGMDLAFKHAVNEPLGNTFLKIASLPTIVILKMNSWLDNSTERERDLADISHILEEAVDVDDDRRFADHIIERGIDFELVSSFIMGEEVGRIAEPQHRALIRRFLDLVGDEEHWSNQRLIAVGPQAWRADDTAMSRRLVAFEDGLGA